MSDLSKVVSARLNPRVDEEKSALDVFNHWVAEGYTPREIITHALLLTANSEPEMFRERGVRVRNPNVGEMLNDLRSQIVDELKAVMQEMWRANPQQFRSMVTDRVDENGDIELDDEFIANAVQSLRPTYRRMREENT